MVHLNRIYTRSGDEGQTSLGDGSRVAKTSNRVAAMGSVDELNASLGVLRAVARLSDEIGELVAKVQNDLFDLGADLCLPDTHDNESRQPLRMAADDVERLEQAIDRFNSELPPLTSFILPGGTAAAAHLHLARTVCRRAECDVLRLAESETINRFAAIYLNRLSDLLFVLARAANKYAATPDVLWRPGGHSAE